MNQPAPVAHAHASLLKVLDPGSAAAEELKRASGRDGALSHDEARLGGRSVRGGLPCARLAALRPLLVEASRAGHRASAVAVSDGSALTVTWSPGGSAAVVLDGAAVGLVGGQDAPALDRAVDRGDAAAVLGLLDDTTFDITLDLTLAVEGAVWVPSVASLVESLSGRAWAGALIQMMRGSGPTVVIVQDAGADVLCCPGLVIAGPRAPSERLRPADGGLAVPPARRGGSMPLPSPGDLSAEPGASGRLEPLREVLAAAGRACCWYWLGRRREVTVDRVTTIFEGPRTFVLDLAPIPGDLADDEHALFAWATATEDPIRDDALHQAVGLAVRGPADLSGAAGPVLRTARSLYELAARGVVAEALASRRAARESATAAAHEAAATARDAVTTTIRPVSTLIIGLGLALVANGRALLSTSVTGVVVALLAGLAVVAWLLAELVTLWSARGLLDAADQDGQLFRDSLSQEDIDAVSSLAVTSSARCDLRRARWAVAIVYLGTAVAIGSVGAVALDGTAATTQSNVPPPVPTGSTSPSPAQTSP